MSKKILIHSIVFSPDGVSTAYLYNDIALMFKKKGYDISILTTTPHYNVIKSELEKQPLKKKILGLYYESDFKGIKVKHVYQKKYKNTFLRILGFVYWHILSFFLGISEKNVDVILSPSPPLSIGFVNILIGKIKRAKVIYNVQEIYPDLLIEEGGLKSKAVVTTLKRLERFVYNRSDKVTTIDQVFYETIVSRFKDRTKLHVIPNFVDTDLYKPLKEYTLDTSLFPETSSLKMMYAGNIGYAQDWEPLILLAEELRNDAVEFFVIGEGAMKDFLEKEKEKKQLEKLHLISYQSRELMPSLLAYSDMQFIFMASQTEEHGFPSKVYTIMACAKPLLVCSGAETPIVNFLRDKDCAYLITSKDISQKVCNMAHLIRNITKEELTKKGSNGYARITEDFSKDSVTNQYIELVNKLLT